MASGELKGLDSGEGVEQWCFTQNSAEVCRGWLIVRNKGLGCVGFVDVCFVLRILGCVFIGKPGERFQPVD